MREVAVIGVGQSAFGKFPLRSAAALGAEAVREAIADCGISPRAIQVAYCARAYDASCTAQGVLKFRVMRLLMSVLLLFGNFEAASVARQH